MAARAGRRRTGLPVARGNEPGPPTEGSARQFARACVSLTVVGLLVRLVLVFWARGTLIDDAYITLRCAENLLQGHGLVYNAGDRVLSLSTPLYGLWTGALLFATGRGLIGYAIGISNAAFFVLAALLLGKLAPDLGRRVACLVLVVFAVHLPFVDAAVTGMETGLFLLGMLASLVLLKRGRMAWLSLVMVLMILIRPEGVLWLLAVAATMVVRRSRPTVMQLLPGVVASIAWLALCARFYDSPIPHPLIAKCGWLAPSVAATDVERAVRTFTALGLFSLPARLQGVPVLRIALAVAAGASLIPFLLGFAELIRRRAVSVALPLLFILYYLFYFCGRGRLDFSWYGIPSGLAYCSTVAVGLSRLVRRFDAVPSDRRVLIFIAAVTPLLLALTVWGWVATRLPYYRLMRESYEKAGSFVDREAPDHARVFLDEAGMIAYAARRFAYDPGEAVSPVVFQYRSERGWKCTTCDLLKAFRPEYVVLSMENARLTRERGDPAWLDTNYTVAARFRGHVVMRLAGPIPPTSDAERPMAPERSS